MTNNDYVISYLIPYNIGLKDLFPVIFYRSHQSFKGTGCNAVQGKFVLNYVLNYVFNYALNYVLNYVLIHVLKAVLKDV